MNCREFEDTLMAELDGELNESGRRALNLHASACEPCRQLRVLHLELDARLAPLARLEPATGLEGRLRSRLDAFRAPWEVPAGLEIAALLPVGIAVALSVHWLLPAAGSQWSWLAGALVLCVGAWLTSADPAPST